MPFIRNTAIFKLSLLPYTYIHSSFTHIIALLQITWLSRVDSAPRSNCMFKCYRERDGTSYTILYRCFTFPNWLCAIYRMASG